MYTMEYYLAIRNNDIWFDGKWLQLENIMLSKPASNRQRPHVFSHVWKTDPKINIYAKISMII
jgi:hypothetical protein